MDDLLTDQQRAEQVRNWLRDNGWYLLGGLVLGLAGLFGWRQWQQTSITDAEQASALYEELLGAIRVDRTVRAEELAERLAKEHGRSPYLDQARLMMAKMKMERSAPEQAAEYLRQVAEEGGSEEMRHIAHLRLARVLAQEGQYEEALGKLEVPEDSAFAPRYHETRGDVYHAMGKLAEARAEYELALQAGQPGVMDQSLLRAKLEDLGPAEAPAEWAGAAPETAGAQESAAGD